MDEDAVNGYVNRAQATIEMAPQMDEANTKAAVLRDFLGLLNWTIPENTQLEYAVKAFGKTYKVDYALVLDGAPVAFLEAKGVDTSLTDKHRAQLEAYLTNEDVNLGILTNGETYEFYRREVVETKVTVNTLGRAELEDLPERVTTLKAFTKDAIQTDEWQKILNRIKAFQKARTTLETQKDDLAAEVGSLFAERASEAIQTQAESQAKEMIDRLMSDIEREIDTDGITTEHDAQTASTPGSTETNPPTADSRYHITISEGTVVHAEFGTSQQVDAFVDAVDHLISAHDLMAALGPLPYIPGRTRPIIHDASSFQGTQMKQPRTVTDGYVLETNLSAAQKQRELQRLADHCGLTARFEGDW